MSRRPGERLRKTVMPKGFDGYGVVRFQCSEGAFNRMKMENMPPPIDYGEVIDGRRYVQRLPNTLGADSVRYRVIWPSVGAGEDAYLPTTSFSLSAKHSNETLFVLAQFLRDQGVEFVGLANKHGNRFKRIELNGMI